MPQTLAGLTQQGRTRQARAPLSPLAEADDMEPDEPRVRNQTAVLSRALATLLSDAEVAHSISGEGGWRIARALVAELLGLWLPRGPLPGTVVDAVMDQLGRAVAAQLPASAARPPWPLHQRFDTSVCEMQRHWPAVAVHPPHGTAYPRSIMACTRGQRVC